MAALPESPPELPLRRGDPDPLVGVVVNGRYRIEGVLATGGMGKIYRGEQLPLGRTVAIKVLNPRYTSGDTDPAFQKRFFLEASILSKLQHPNIVTVYDYGRIENADEEAYFMAMEFLPGETLHRRLRARGRLTAPEVFEVTRQIARGLREAHRQGIAHRDLKPSNIMLVPEEDGTELVKILDFGLVKVLADDSEELTKEGSFLGSPRYMSPEQIAHGKVDLRTDLYSLGVIMYQALAGRTPFESENSVHILMAHLQNPVPPMRLRNPEADVPEALEAFVRKCLEKDPAQRPASIDEFVRGLREVHQSLGFEVGPTGTHSAPYVARSTPAPVAPLAPSAVSAHPVDPSHVTATGPLAAAQPSSSHRAAFFAGVGLVVAVALGAGVTLGLGRRDPAPAPVAAPTAPAGRPAPLVVPPPPPPAGAPSSFTLVLESEPAGATVFENDAPLGTTPVQLSVDNDSVRARPRSFTLRADGYQPYTVVQGPSGEAVRAVATLVPVHGVRPTARPQGRPRPRGNANSHPTGTNASDQGTIRLTR